MSYTRIPNPIWWIPDHVGLPLNDEYYAHFLENTLPYLPQAVYRDDEGTAIWTGGIVQFQPGGTLPDNMFFDPTKVYRMEIRHGDTQTDALIWEVNDIVPSGGNTPETDVIISTNNQITNSQFSQISFVSPLSITTAGTYDIAPGWSLVLVGSGTASISQVILLGNADAVNKPPYALRFNLSGWTSAKLYQRFNGTGGIWTSTSTQRSAVAVSLTAQAELTAHEMIMTYVPSTGTPQEIARDTINTSVYQVLQGAVILNASDDTSASNVAYIDLVITLPPTGIVNISNAQIVGQVGDSIPLSIPYEQETIERQKDYLYHIYANELLIKPKQSLLVGWNFSLNPYQFGQTTFGTVSTQVGYITDQTILRQESASCLQAGKAAVGERQCLKIKALTSKTANRFALIQYIDPASIRAYWSYYVSALARVKLVTTHSTSCRMKMRLIHRASLPSAVSASEPIASWAANGDPVFAAGWTALTPLNDPAYVLTGGFSEGADSFPAYAFEKMLLPTSTNADMTLGIVLYTMDNLNETSGTEDYILFDKVGLVPSQFACDAEAQTFDQVLRECQFYYENTYNPGVLAGAVTNTGMLYRSQTSNATTMTPKGFDVSFTTAKRIATYTLNIFSPASGTTDAVFADYHGFTSGDISFSANWTPTKAIKGFVADLVSGAPIIIHAGSAAADSRIFFHYEAKALLGV